MGTMISCPECGEPAVVDFQLPKCTNQKCKWFDHTVWVEHTMSIPDTGDPVEEEIESLATAGVPVLYRPSGGNWRVMDYDDLDEDSP